MCRQPYPPRVPDSPPPSTPPTPLLRRLAHWLGGLCGSFAVLLLAGWTLGHIVTDRFYLTQFLWWIPTVIMLPASLVLGLAWRLFAPGGAYTEKIDFTGSAGPPRRASNAQKLYLLACGVVAAYVLIEEWRLDNAVRISPRSPGVRLVAWNESWAPMKPSHDNLVALKGDIILIANPHYTFDAAGLRASMGPTTFSARGGILTVFSKFPILRHGFCPLGIAPEPHRPMYPRLNPDHIDNGEAMWLELDAPPLGGRVIAWCIDIPSDVWLDRERAMREARTAIDTFRGPVMVRQESGLDRPELMTGEAMGFPAPDIIMGDCNTPRGSYSLTLLHANMHHAFDDAGVGPQYTYPRLWPIIAIDQILLSPRLRASLYHSLDLGGARHRAQLAVLHSASK